MTGPGIGPATLSRAVAEGLDGRQPLPPLECWSASLVQWVQMPDQRFRVRGRVSPDLASLGALQRGVLTVCVGTVGAW
jgi:hypothetical protein